VSNRSAQFETTGTGALSDAALDASFSWSKSKIVFAVALFLLLLGQRFPAADAAVLAYPLALIDVVLLRALAAQLAVIWRKQQVGQCTRLLLVRVGRGAAGHSSPPSGFP